MGIVHKLKPEIIHYVIEQKKENPSLSCRALAEIVNRILGTNLSKSSINNILKKADLSSPVGRRMGARQKSAQGFSKKFRLADGRKKDFFADLSTHPILADLSESSRKEGEVDGVGNIFLKAAEWEVSRQPILEALLKEHCPGGKHGKIRDIAAVLGFLKSFQIESFEGLSQYSGQGLWAINSTEKSLTEADVLDVIEDVRNGQEFFLKFSLKAPQIFSRAAGFRYVLKDGTNFFVDGQNASIWKNVQKRFSVSLAKATGNLAKMLNNVQFAIFCSISPKESGKIQEKKHIFDFIQAFENVQSKKIQRIELVGEDGQILGNFDEIPQIQRFFVAGVWPWEKMFHQFLDIKKIVRQGKVDLAFLDREASFKETSIKWTEGKTVTLRGIVLYEAFMRLPFLVLVSNADAAVLSAEDIIHQYCQRWPNMEKGGSFSLLSDIGRWAADFSDGETPFWDALLGEAPCGRDPVCMAADQMLALLDGFAKKQFFPDDYVTADFYTMRNRFYSLSGRIQADHQRFLAEIFLPQGFPYAKDLHFAAQRVNESGVMDFDDRQVFIKLI